MKDNSSSSLCKGPSATCVTYTALNSPSFTVRLAFTEHGHGTETYVAFQPSARQSSSNKSSSARNNPFQVGNKKKRNTVKLLNGLYKKMMRKSVLIERSCVIRYTHRIFLCSPFRVLSVFFWIGEEAVNSGKRERGSDD